MQKLDRSSSMEGSEAKIDLISWYGFPAVKKIRLRKNYRDSSLDRSLRTRRTKQEAEILHYSKLAGVSTPELYFVDPQASEIVMEFVEGHLLKDLPNDHKRKGELFETVGKLVARLHKKSIIHGDLTTKNMIMADDGIVILDFGLSFVSNRIEDKAEDLHLMKQALRSSSPLAIARRDFESVVQGYRSEVGHSTTEIVRKQITKIELRGRYARVD
ncbi:MAG: KEOPS complex kinase/ATPase Bud32 [Thaumarchaeota archaeon]|nr:KEOPS complex kinase/ATPase Bud32 [Nitrososphaerota archaeon]